jgi:hypothetical protein
MRRTRDASHTSTAPPAISAAFSTVPVCAEATATNSESKRKNRTTWSAKRSSLNIETSLPPLAHRVEGVTIAQGTSDSGCCQAKAAAGLGCWDLVLGVRASPDVGANREP